jgi:gliding motility-associated-like protein
VTYTTQPGQSNYIWTFTGVLSIDYTITSGGTIADNTVTLRWLTSGSKTVGINYTNAGGCTAVASAFSTPTMISLLPTVADAGPDQTGASTCGLTTITLAANTPVVGTGSWSIIGGLGGIITAPNSPTSTFSGTAGTAYVLRWTISNAPCTPSTDDVNITFNQNPTIANAGPDQTDAAMCGLTTATLAANTPVVGTGAWTITSGAGGTVTTLTSPTSTFTGVAGTAYTLRWTISNATCTASTDDVNVTFNQTPTVANAGPDQTGASMCGLTTATLAANAPVVGTGAWTIISGAGGAITTPTSPTSTFTGVAGTAYTLRWTISNAPCTASTDDVNITFNQNPTVTITDPAAVCVSSTADLTAAGVTAGSSAGLIFTYWTDALATTVYATPALATAGTYYIKGTDPVTGCYDIKPVTVTTNPAPTVTITNPAAVCGPSTADLTAAGVTAGSSAGLIFTYWTDALATIAYATPAAATAGTYYIKGTDPVTSCYDIKPVTVTVNPAPTVTITDPAAVCAPSTVDLTAAGVTSGSSAGLIFTYWTDALATTAYATPATATAGTYYIKGTDPVTSCYDIKPVTVTVNPVPTVTITDPAVCGLSTADLTASGITAGSSAGLIFTYWTDALATTTYSTPASATTGTYYIKGTDPVTSCYDIKPVTVTINPAPTVTITNPAAVCGLSTADLTAPGITAGSSAGLIFTYWTDALATTAYATPAAATAGTYYIKGTDAVTSCYDIKPVSVNSNPSPTVTTTQVDVACFGGNAGTATAIPAGGTGIYTYSWNTIPVQTSVTATGLVAGTYIVTVSDVNGCTATASTTITEPAVLSIASTKVDVSCPGDADGSITLTLTGGTQPYSVIWSDGVLTKDRQNIPGGTYSVVVTDKNGCAASLDVVVGITGSDKCIEIPTIITPNNDGVNDTWKIKNIDLFPDAEVFVFTRWGKLVFHAKNLAANQWNGTFEGKLLPTDSYHYVLHLNDGSKPRSGVISIIR